MKTLLSGLLMLLPVFAVAQEQQHSFDVIPYNATVGVMRFWDKTQGHYIGLSGLDTLSANTTFRLPAADGTVGQVLKTDGAANLGWASGTGTLTSFQGRTAASAVLSSADVSTGLAVAAGVIFNAGVLSFNSRTGTVTLSAADVTAAVQDLTIHGAGPSFKQVGINDGFSGSDWTLDDGSHYLAIRDGAGSLHISLDNQHIGGFGTLLTTQSLFAEPESGYGNTPAFRAVAATGQTANIFEAQLHSGTVTFNVDPTGQANAITGITLGASSNSYLRTFSGAPSCAGVTDGWFGYDATNDKFYICQGGAAKVH